MSKEKWFLITFSLYNVFYLILSFIMLIIGIITKYYLSIIHDNYNTYEKFSFTTISFIVIGAGFMIIVPFMSCTILINKSTRTAVMYILIMLVVITVDFFVGYKTLNVPKDVENANNETFTEMFKNDKSNTTALNNIDAIFLQLNLKCYGLNGLSYWRNDSRMISFCCEQLHKTNSSENVCDQSIIWQEGCLKKSIEFPQKITNVLCIFIFIFAAIKVTGILFFFVLY